MLDKDKIIIVIYLGAGNVCDTYEYIMNVEKNIRNLFDESVKLIFAPLHDEFGVKFECINPVLLNEEQYKAVEKKINTLETTLNELIDEKDKQTNE